MGMLGFVMVLLRCDKMGGQFVEIMNVVEYYGDDLEKIVDNFFGWFFFLIC